MLHKSYSMCKKGPCLSVTPDLVPLNEAVKVKLLTWRSSSPLSLFNSTLQLDTRVKGAHEEGNTRHSVRGRVLVGTLQDRPGSTLVLCVVAVVATRRGPPETPDVCDVFVCLIQVTQ